MTQDAQIERDLWYASVVSSEAEAEFVTFLAELRELRPFSAVVQRVLSLLGDDDFEVAEVRRLIEEDPALAARVLKVANSAAFSGVRACDSVQQAVVRLGRDTVREMLVALSALSLFQDLLGWGQQVRDHCASTAALARVLADAAGPKLPAALLAGLLHDVGKLLLLQARRFPTPAMPLAQVELLKAADGSAAIERQHLGFDHAVLGGHAARMWRLPHPIPEAVAWHHRPETVYGGGRRGAGSDGRRGAAGGSARPAPDE